jgi:hypothetical protein
MVIQISVFESWLQRVDVKEGVFSVIHSSCGWSVSWLVPHIADCGDLHVDVSSLDLNALESMKRELDNRSFYSESLKDAASLLSFISAGHSVSLILLKLLLLNSAVAVVRNLSVEGIVTPFIACPWIVVDVVRANDFPYTFSDLIPGT